MIYKERTLVGKIIKYLFIVFNIIMFILFCYVLFGKTDINLGDNTSQMIEALAQLIELCLVTFFWVSGDIILGLFVLFTRVKL